MDFQLRKVSVKASKQLERADRKEGKIMATTASIQPNGSDIFSASNIKACEKYVALMQKKLDRAVAVRLWSSGFIRDNNKSDIRWFTHILSKKSRAVRILAVNRVTTLNQGRYTAGVDGVRMIRGRKGINEKLRLSLLNATNIKKKPSPIRRTHIPKPNGKKRPLGIPTMADRIIQDILLTTLEPITEYHASDNSYGFRPKRSCHDATQHLFIKLSQRGSKQWVIEGDIRGCFDNISHEHILKTLKSWDVKRNIVNIIERMLKSKILFKDMTQNVDTGTPQGGILSPMLANVALTALDDYCHKEFGERVYRSKKQGGSYTQNPIVRYADDFVIICKSKHEAELIKGKIATFLKEKIGLELSNEKTKITHTADGLNFLGFNIRKYTQKSPKSKYHSIGKLLIKPQKEKVINFLRRTQEVLSNNKTAKQESILKMLNPMLQGFGMYNRFAVSQKTFSTIDSRLWHKLWRWAKRRHPKKSKKWIMRKYFTTTGRKWVFKDEARNKIIKIASIPIVRFVKVEKGRRVHADDKETREYWQKRVYTNALSQVYTIKVERLMKKQKGICPCCGNPITKDDIADQKVHAHHMLPRSKGGSEKPNNLTLLHQDCHVLTHQVLTRDEMAYWMFHKLNYILKSNIVYFQKHPNVIV
jgi:RNA-directed DNA polymerase